MVDETQNVAPHDAVADEAASAVEAAVPDEQASSESEPAVVDLTEPTVGDTGSDIGSDTGNAPDVDELETRLADLQRAMDQLQSGDLDGAEAAVEALEQQLAASRESTS